MFLKSLGWAESNEKLTEAEVAEFLQRGQAMYAAGGTSAGAAANGSAPPPPAAGGASQAGVSGLTAAFQGANLSPGQP